MLLVLTGLPCSGKSTVARRLAEIAREDGVAARVVTGEEEGEGEGGDDGGEGRPRGVGGRDAAYGDPSAEKNARSAFKSAVERGLSARAVTVADAPNAIKGYRYELWCAARAAGGRAAVVHVDAAAAAAHAGSGGGGDPAAAPRRRNAARLARGEDGYCAAVFDDLCGRYERPDSRNRWDAPLFTVRWRGGGGTTTAGWGQEDGAGGKKEEEEERLPGGQDDADGPAAAAAAVRAPEVDTVLRAALFAVTGGKAGAPPRQAPAAEGAAAAAATGAAAAEALEEQEQEEQGDDDAAGRRRAAALSSGGLASGLRAAGGCGERLRPGISTARPALAETNTLYAIDRECQEVVNLILEAQACGPAGIAELGGGGGERSASQPPPPLRLRLPPGGVPVAELRAHKRAFLKLATRREHGRMEDPAAARRMFVEYLERELESRVAV